MNWKLLIWAAALLPASTMCRADERFEIGGSARVRIEFKNNADFNDSTGDYTDSTGSRFRADLKVKASEKVRLFFQPQFSKVWGEPELVPSSASTNASTNTSGATNDTGIDVHQAHLNYAVNDATTFTLGRKELNYGDELLVGGVGWSNVGRSFDLVQASYSYAGGRAEAFNSRLVDRNATAAAAGDRVFSGLYSAHRLGEYVQNADGYLLYLDDNSTSPNSSTLAYGLRIKSPLKSFDYRAEATFESVRTVESSREAQYDLELGYTFSEAKKIRVAFELFSATRNFDQLFPTGHKWLGYADLFSRRNIQGYRGRISGQISDGLVMTFDYHRFERQDASQPAYKFNGAAYGIAGDAEFIGEEFDLVVTHKIDSDFTLEGGVAHVVPGQYLKDNGGTDAASFYYVQVTTAF